MTYYEDRISSLSGRDEDQTRMMLDRSTDLQPTTTENDDE